jgi:antitoxin YefM
MSWTIIVVMKTLSLADVKARLSAVVNEVESTHERVVITRNGRPVAVVMAIDDLDGLEETLDLVNTPGAARQIAEAEDELDAGGGTSEEEMAEVMASRRRRGSGSAA